MIYSHFGRKSSLTTLHQMGHFLPQLLYTSLPYLFLLTLVPIRNYVYEFFTFLMSSHVDYNIEDSRDFLSLIHWWTFCSLSQNDSWLQGRWEEKISHLGFDLREFSYWNRTKTASLIKKFLFPWPVVTAWNESYTVEFNLARICKHSFVFRHELFAGV